MQIQQEQQPREPIVWKYVLDDRGYMGAHEVTCPLQLIYEEVGLQAWLLQIGLDNGFTLERLLEIYGETNADLFVCPRSMQDGEIKTDEYGSMTNLWVFENEEEKTKYLIDDDNSCLVDCNEAVVFDPCCLNHS